MLVTTPAGHIGGSATLGGTGVAGGVTFLAAAGDNGAYDFKNDPTVVMPEYPTDSANVVSVGGTSLTVNGTNPNYTYGNETAWGDGTSSGSDGGGGGGLSLYEPQPSYQSSAVSAYSTTVRVFPDLSMDAAPQGPAPDFGLGIPEYDSYDNGNASPWSNGGGGTSYSTPMFAGLIPIADEGRAISGLGSLDGSTQTLPDLYKLPANAYHDITVGSTGASPEFAAGPGYDLATGLGSPVANVLIPELVGYAGVSSVSPSIDSPAGGTRVTITGYALTGLSAVDFGGTPATSITYNSDGSITVTDTAHVAGIVDVTVANSSLASPVSVSDEFTYTSSPIVTSVAPSNGPVEGGTQVTISGYNLAGISAVEFGGVAATNISYNPNGTIQPINEAQPTLWARLM